MQNFVNYYDQSIKNQQAFYIPAGNAKVSFVDVRDIAAIAVKSLVNHHDKYAKKYDITGRDALSFVQVTKIFSGDRKDNELCRYIS